MQYNLSSEDTVHPFMNIELSLNHQKSKEQGSHIIN